MSDAALSVFVFSIYLVITGLGFIFIPNILLSTLKLPTTNEPWIRILGIVIAAMGFFYVIGAEYELSIFLWATIVERYAILVSFTLLVISKKAPAILIMFGIVDAICATSTMLVL